MGVPIWSWPSKCFIYFGEVLMDPWEVFSYLCKTVVEEQNCTLEIMLTPSGISMQLIPLGEEEEEDD